MESPVSTVKSLNKVMEELFISKDGSDVTFVVHGKEIEAHKFIVTSRSPVLKVMVDGPMAPADQRHAIGDPKITSEDFEKFLRFLYNDKLEYPLEKADIKALIHLGSFYDVPNLLKKCTDIIRVYTWNSQEAYEYAEFALRYSPATSELLEKCLEQIFLRHMDAPMTYRISDGVVEWISKDLVLEIVKRRPSDGIISENSLFKRVFKWAKQECIRKNDRQPTNEDVQAIMAPLMPYFVLTELSPLIMATTVKTYKLIPTDQLVNFLADHLVEVYDFRRPCCARGVSNPRNAIGSGSGSGRGGRGGISGDRDRENRFAPPTRGMGRRGGYDLLHD